MLAEVTCMTHETIRRATARHEAGHAVAAMHYGRSIQFAAVLGNFGVLQVETRLPAGPIRATSRALRLAEQQAVILYAGPVAEANYHGLEINAYAYEVSDAIPDELLGYERDLEAVTAIFFRTNGQLDRAGLMQRAKRLLDRRANTHAVRRIADALLERGYLDGEELLEIRRHHLPSRR